MRFYDEQNTRKSRHTNARGYQRPQTVIPIQQTDLLLEIFINQIVESEYEAQDKFSQPLKMKGTRIQSR